MKQQTGLYLFIYFFDAREKAETKSFVPPKHLKTMRNFFKEFTFQIESSPQNLKWKTFSNHETNDLELIS